MTAPNFFSKSGRRAAKEASVDTTSTDKFQTVPLPSMESKPERVVEDVENELKIKYGKRK